MLFVESRFLLFFAVVFTIYWLLRAETLRRVWLTGAGFFFYCCFFIGPPFEFLMNVTSGSWSALPRGWWFPVFLLGSMLLDYAVGLGIGAAKTKRCRRAWLLASLCANLGVLGTFKYAGFMQQSAVAFLTWLGFKPDWPTLNLILPIGISFYTFQSLSYSIEVYRGHIAPVRRFLDLAFFISFFPQLVAGPIVRATTFLPQLDRQRRWSDVDVRSAAVLFFTGFIKKTLVAENAAPIVDAFYANPSSWSCASAWIAVLAYALQIYGDFSGYSDMARAVARLLGYELPLNFDFPYLASNLRDFWRRWHISLSSWLRDYLYISLGGNRGTSARVAFNLFATMTIGGLWHGAAWTFVVWGMLHGAGLMVHRWWDKGPATKMRQLGWAWSIAATVLTFLFVLFAWIPFRAPTFAAVVKVMGLLFGFGGGHRVFSPLAWLFFGGLVLIHAAGRNGVWRRVIDWLPDWVLAVVLGMGFAVALHFMPMQYRAFIYFQF